MNKRPRKTGSRADRKEARRKSALFPPKRAKPHGASAIGAQTGECAAEQPAPPATAPNPWRLERRRHSIRIRIRRTIHLTAFAGIAFLLGWSVSPKIWALIPSSQPGALGPHSSPATGPSEAPNNASLPAQDPLSRLDSVTAAWREGTVSAFGFEKNLREVLPSLSPEKLRTYLDSPSFVAAPPRVRGLLLQRIAEGNVSTARTILESDAADRLTDPELHVLLAPALTIDFPAFIAWMRTVRHELQLRIAPLVAKSVRSDSQRCAIAMSSLDRSVGWRTIQHALSVLAKTPDALLRFVYELPTTLQPDALFEGLRAALASPAGLSAIRLNEHPKALSTIQGFIRSRESASAHRDVLEVDAIATALPNGVARMCALEFLLERIARVDVDSAAKRITQLAAGPDALAANLGFVRGCASKHPLRALQTAATLTDGSRERREALWIAAYAARHLEPETIRRWLASATLSPDERELLTGESP